MIRIHGALVALGMVSTLMIGMIIARHLLPESREFKIQQAQLQHFKDTYKVLSGSIAYKDDPHFDYRFVSFNGGTNWIAVRETWRHGGCPHTINDTVFEEWPKEEQSLWKRHSRNYGQPSLPDPTLLRLVLAREDILLSLQKSLGFDRDKALDYIAATRKYDELLQPKIELTSVDKAEPAPDDTPAETVDTKEEPVTDEVSKD